MNKYHNVKTIIDGIKFDSKAEARRYQELKLLEKAGQIRNLVLQPKFELVPKLITGDCHPNERAVTYTADFSYSQKIGNDVVVNGHTLNTWYDYVEDVKSEATRKDKAYIIKRKLFRHKYPDIIFCEIE